MEDSSLDDAGVPHLLAILVAPSGRSASRRDGLWQRSVQLTALLDRPAHAMPGAPSSRAGRWAHPSSDPGHHAHRAAAALAGARPRLRS
eukprot:15454436-Alexandrium_andersonii.AAC.1